MAIYKNNVLDGWNTKLEEKIVEEKIQLLKRESKSDIYVHVRTCTNYYYYYYSSKEQ